MLEVVTGGRLGSFKTSQHLVQAFCTLLAVQDVSPQLANAATMPAASLLSILISPATVNPSKRSFSKFTWSYWFLSQ